MRRGGVNAGEARAVARVIVERRTRLSSDRLPPDVDEQDLRAVIDFTRRHPAPGDAGEEALDRVTILVHLAGELSDRLEEAIRDAREGGSTWREVAASLRVRSPQAAEQTWLRLVDLRHGDEGTRDDAAGRRLRSRRPAAQTAASATAGLDAPELRGALMDLVTRARLIADEEAAVAVASWRSEVLALSGRRLAVQLRTLLPLQLDGVTLPVEVQSSLERLWPLVESWSAAESG